MERTLVYYFGSDRCVSCNRETSHTEILLNGRICPGCGHSGEFYGAVAKTKKYKVTKKQKKFLWFWLTINTKVEACENE